MIRVNSEKLRAVVASKGYASLEDVAIEAKRQGLKLSLATIYNIANNENWTRAKLEELCGLLQCVPTDFVEFENGENGHTHVSPQPEEDAEQVALESK